MKTHHTAQITKESGSALILTMIMSGVALALLASAMSWSAGNTRMTHRSIQYNRSTAAAEAATEKVLAGITQDFLWGGQKQVTDNLSVYRATVPTASDSTYWNRWEFNNGAGQTSATYVQPSGSATYVVIDSAYSGLKGFVSSYQVVSHARDSASLQNVVGGVFQEVQLARIPIFQFALYGSSDMEISCGQPFNITGRVHANGTLYVEPDNSMTFQSAVSSAVDILFRRHPLDTRNSPSGSVVYQGKKNSPVAAMTLPIGATNTPTAIRDIIHPPAAGEDPNSPLGRLRYYNQSDLILIVSDTGITASSQKYNSLATTPIPPAQLEQWAATNSSFWDAREEKFVRPVDIDVGKLASWSKTNANLSAAIGTNDRLASLYILDKRTLPGTSLAAVRLLNGLNLPTQGLTVATARPLYVWGHYNQTTAANLGTTNTITTRPASVVADAVTILSANWTDAQSTLPVASRMARPTTVNAAILTGVVETTFGKYSGGMENFPRFLETWGLANPLRYNGSMVKMFPSLYATAPWGKANVYAPPKRDWSYDLNFEDPTKLPPLTPSLLKVFRGQWSTVAPGKNTVAAIAY